VAAKNLSKQQKRVLAQKTQKTPPANQRNQQKTEPREKGSCCLFSETNLSSANQKNQQKTEPFLLVNQLRYVP
jgi:hypothetical protein